MSSKNILFVTDNDDPTGDSLQLTEVAKIKRKVCVALVAPSRRVGTQRRNTRLARTFTR